MYQIRDRVDVTLSEEQLLLRESARDFLARECPMELVRSALEEPGREPAGGDALWRRMAELGWMGLALPAAYGGAGLGLVDQCVLFEEMGRVLLPLPFWSSVTLATTAIARAGTEPQCAAWLPGIADGTRRATLVEAPSLRTQANGPVLRLDGTQPLVPDAQVADVLVVALRRDAALRLALVDANAPGLAIRPVAFTDGTRTLCEVRFDDVAVPADRILGDGAAADDALTAALDAGRVGLAAEACGGAARVLELAVDFARTREQFGKPIGSFQAIQHKCADMLVRVESARSAMLLAAWSLDEGEPDAHTAACMAKAYCSEAYTAVAGQGIQIHGGQGFTWEQDLHLFYKRAKAGELLLGDPAWCREEIARDVVDGHPTG